MSLITPIALALGITLPIVVVFYLLKVRRHDEEVSSTFLWNDLIRDLAAHEPLQRLKWNLLLLLQLLALALPIRAALGWIFVLLSLATLMVTLVAAWGVWPGPVLGLGGL